MTPTNLAKVAALACWPQPKPNAAIAMFGDTQQEKDTK